QDAFQVNDLLKQCSLLRIEDLLPFFSASCSLEQLRQPVCDALKQYQSDIEGLKEEMSEVIESTEQIRDDLRRMQHQHTIIKSSDLCSQCGTEVFLQDFFSFPCCHLFHVRCLEQHLLD